MRGGLRLLRVWAVPTTAQLAGMSWGAPPPPYHLPGWQWDHRQPAVGARVPPSAGELDQVNLLAVVTLAPGASRGSTPGFEFWYHAGGKHYRIQIPVGLILVNRKSC